MVARLKELRIKKNISQQRLAIELGISQQSVNKYENHSIEPDIFLLIKIADFFGVSVDYLIGHSDVPRQLEVVQRYSLNSDEALLIEKYRQLTAAERESIALVMDNYLKKA
jgi:transcriptional regulator with XRE-family HTH domain